MNHYDVVVVIGYFRSATAVLSLLKHAPRQWRIGLLEAPLDPAHRDKNQAAHEKFLGMCVQFGAQRLLGDVVSASLLLVQQWVYEDEFVDRVRDLVRARKTVGLMTFAMAGIATHDKYLAQFSIRRAYAVNMRFTRFLITRREAESTYRDVELTQVGLPFGRYPIFDDFVADYLVASPTAFSFDREEDKHSYLESALALLDQIGPGRIIAYKSHNGMVRDYFTPTGYTHVGRVLSWLPGMGYMLGVITVLPMPSRIRLTFARIRTGLLHSRLLRKVSPMAELTTHAEFALEAFLPGVRKGVIGGLSNTIWGTLYFGRTFYNCVDITKKSGQSSWLGKNASHLLGLNLEFFGVPYCRSRLDGGSRGEGVIEPFDLEGDLIATVTEDVRLAELALHR